MGYNPDPINGNLFVGGNWTLTSKGKDDSISRIIGRIKYGDGSVTWSGGAGGTDQGHVVITKLSIISASGVFRGVTGGSFDGTDNHVSKIIIGGVTVPTITGTLTLK
jgi:hypothetical protein